MPDSTGPVVDIDRTVREVVARLRDHAHPQALAHADKQLKGTPASYWIYAGPMRQIARDVVYSLKDQTKATVLRLAHALIMTNIRDARHIVYEVVKRHRRTFESLTAREIEKLGKGIDSWDTVDDFGRSISGPAWKRRMIQDARVNRWARSKDRWWRRCALVTTIALNERDAGNGDAKRTLSVCKMLVDDHDDMVVKAMSWALRRLGERDPKTARAFMKEHGGRLANRVKREVAHKLTTGLKNPRRKSYSR